MIHSTPDRLEVRAKAYTLTLDPASLQVRALLTGGSDRNWVGHGEGLRFGAPFCNGSQSGETFLNLRAQPQRDDRRLEALSTSGRTRLTYRLTDDHFEMVLHLPKRLGPRAGIELDLNHLDLPNGTPWTQQVTPVVLHTADDLSYAYLVWHRADDDFLITAINGPLAAWRIKYNYFGHRMVGFQALTEASDVVCRPGVVLPLVDRLSVKVGFATSVAQAQRVAFDLLGLAAAQASVTGGPVGVRAPMLLWGPCAALIHQPPSGPAAPLPHRDGRADLILAQPGVHQVTAVSPAGRRHVTRLLALDDWQTIYDRSGRFHARHFQHECGAFSRAISVDSLKPDKTTFEGLSFGDPLQPSSCRTGEFGGFCAWAMLKRLLVLGDEPELRRSVDRYMLDWALSRGHEDKPFPGAVCKRPSEFMGRTFSPYHVFKEINYAQHEVFLLGQLIDYYRLTRAPDVLDDAIGLAEHFITDHLRADGMAVNQNSPQQEAQDYTTVDAPSIAFERLGHLLQELGHPKAPLFLDWARRIADFVLRRGLSFPTEGEPCTEDGSFANAMWTLLNAYLHLDPKPEYLQMGRQMVELHDKLVLHSHDCRTHHSTLRFWETQYESAAWGPSINAGHGWTIWTADAKVLLHLITGEIRWLREAWCAYLTALAKIDANGGMFPCYTPDLIPGTPHTAYWGGTPADAQDAQITTIPLAWGFPDAYSASGNHALVRAAESWAFISGLIVEESVAINGRLDDQGLFVSAAPRFNRLSLSVLPAQPLRVRVEPGRDFALTFDQPIAQRPRITGLADLRWSDRSARGQTTGSTVEIRPA